MEFVTLISCAKSLSKVLFGFGPEFLLPAHDFLLLPLHISQRISRNGQY